MKILNKKLLDEILASNCIFVLYPKLGMHGASVPDEFVDQCAMSGCSNQLSGYKRLVGDFLKQGFKIYAIGSIEMKKQEAFMASIGAGDIEFISDENFVLESELDAATFVTNSGFKFYFRQNLVFVDKKLVFKQLVKDTSNDAKNMLDHVKQI